jgi:prepilin-type processing-associated H-X9-DG protein
MSADSSTRVILIAVLVVGTLLTLFCLAPVALLLPAIQMSRESARRLQCKNHLKQMSLASTWHAEHHGFFPSGGWGSRWLGDPDRGFGERQPGGWMYDILPYIEQESLHSLGRGASPSEKRAAAAECGEIPIALFFCPSRRLPRPGPLTLRPLPDGSVFYNADPISMAAKSDYAANAGGSPVIWGDGPASLEEGDVWQDIERTMQISGVVFPRSEVSMSHVIDGFSNTYLVGEKYLNPDHYATGRDLADNNTAYAGDASDECAWTVFPPRADRPGVAQHWRFGSAHGDGVHMALCDGSVRTIRYSIDPEIHRCLGDRRDGQTVNVPDF